MEVDVYDPWADAAEVRHEYGIEIINDGAKPVIQDYSAIVLAVAHQEFKSWPIQKSQNQVIFDVTSVLDKEKVDARL